MCDKWEEMALGMWDEDWEVDIHGEEIVQSVQENVWISGANKRNAKMKMVVLLEIKIWIRYE